MNNVSWERIAPPEEAARVAREQGLSPSTLAFAQYQRELELSHHFMDGIERHLGYQTKETDHVPDRLDVLQKVLAAGVFLTRGHLFRVVMISAGVGLLLGYVLARRNNGKV
jgi:hypothetical protein